MHHAGRKLIRGQLVKPFHTEITESVKCKMRQERLRFSAADIGVNGFCLAQGIGVKIAVLVQNLRMADDDFLSLFSMHPDLCSTGQVLSEVHQLFSLRRDDQFLCRNPLRDAHRFIFLGGQY